MASNRKRTSRQKPGVEAFEDEEVEDEEEVEEEETDEEDASEDADEEEDEDEEDAEPVDLGFAPFIVSESQEWELTDILSEAVEGENIYFYVPPSDETSKAKWYVLRPVNIGEMPEA